MGHPQAAVSSLVPNVMPARKIPQYGINHYKFLPTIAEIREVAEKGMLLASGSVPISAAEAWQEVKRAIGAVGRYEKPIFSTPELQKTVERLGWQDICDSPLSNKEILYAQFRNAYTEEINRQKDIQNYVNYRHLRLKPKRWRLPNSLRGI